MVRLGDLWCENFDSWGKGFINFSDHKIREKICVLVILAYLLTKESGNKNEHGTHNSL